MSKAARAIILQGNKLLVMHRNKQGSQYFTLVGGHLNEHETPEQAVVREVKEETGLDVTQQRLVFHEAHPEPYNEQFIFLCEVASYDSVAIQESSEEGFMNRIGVNTHQPMWVDVSALERLPFRTPQLQQALLQALRRGFPDTPVEL